MAQGTLYENKEDLITAVKLLIYNNNKKKITGDVNQKALLHLIESLWDRGLTQDLQSVLENGSSAGGQNGSAEEITTTYDALCNNVRLILGRHNAGTTEAPGYTYPLVDIEGDGNIYGQIKVEITPQKLRFYGVDNDSYEVLVEKTSSSFGHDIKLLGGGQKIILDGSGIDIAALFSSFEITVEQTRILQSSQGIYSGIGDHRDKYAVGLNEDDNPTATWDIKGDLRVRSLENSPTDLKILTVDETGAVHTQEIQEPVDIVFTAANSFISATVKRMIRGIDVTFKCSITYGNDTGTSSKLDMPLLIPQDFLDYKWLKLDNAFSIISNPSNFSEFGGVEIDSASSYSAGSLISSTSKLFFAGTTKGTGRRYNFDEPYNINIDQGFVSIDRLNNEETPNTNNYYVDSPLDLTTQGFNMSFMNMREYTGVVSPQGEGTVEFILKGTLI